MAEINGKRFRRPRHWTLAQVLEHYSRSDPSGCRIWIGGGRDRKGYGLINWRGHSQRAHRAAWSLANGPIPPGMHVCHKCDVPACINPDHLWLGTNADNRADMVAKGRSAAGARNGGAKLTWDQVSAIRADERKLRLIAAAHGISIGQVSVIKNGLAWRP